jgi:hypothetical protein
MTPILVNVGMISACGGNTLTRDAWVEERPTGSEDAGVGLPNWKGPGVLSPETGDAGAPVFSSSTEVWVGQAEAPVTFPSKSTDGGASSPERILLIVQRRPTGITGTITFGTGAPPPPPDGPDVLYPIGRVANTSFLSWLVKPIDGFTYSLRSVLMDAPRVSIEFSPAELWQAWCVEQTPHEWPNGRYECTPPGEEPNGVGTADPVKASFCAYPDNAVCDCVATGCQAAQGFAMRIDFVANKDVLSGETAGDTRSFVNPGPVAVRLRRQR